MFIPPKAQKSGSRARTRATRRACKLNGFALVITLMLMILLAVLAVGLLSLSSISLRGSSNEDLGKKAQANARLALILAIGELQKTLGPDKAISANAEILRDSPAKPQLMGAWKSWDYTTDLLATTASPDYVGEKKTRFQGWLVSSPKPATSTDLDFASTAWTDKTITLADAASYGGTLPPAGSLRAGRVPLTKNGKEEGAYAWHVSDESTKARINLYRDPSLNTTVSQQRSLLSGHRPDVSMVSANLDFLGKDTDSTAFEKAEVISHKITSLGQAELVSPADLDKLRPLRDEITPYSMGVLSDVRSGGLKKDLSSIFELSRSPSSITLPPEFNNQGLYASTHKITGEADPRWSRLSSYYNIFRKLTDPESSPAYNEAPVEVMSVPGVGGKPAQPALFTPVPIVEKVQVLFSILTRPLHGGPPDNGVDGQLHLMYTPVVTLHNPYNVSLSFDMLKVSFESLPVGFSFSVNGTSTTGGILKPFNELYDQGRTRGFINKSIVLKISNWRTFDTTMSQHDGSKDESEIERDAERENSDPKDPVVMKPGQTLLCSPYIDPSSEFGRTDLNTFFDYGNQLTRSIKTKPGFFGNSVGFDLDWLGNNSVVQYKRTPVPANILVSCGATKPTLGGDASFDVKTEITVKGQKRSCGGIQMRYPDLATLEKVLKRTSFSTTATASFVPNEGGGDSRISQHASAKPFALFSAYARTTSGGVNEAGVRATTSSTGKALVNGVYAGKPFLFNNAALPVLVSDLKNEKLASISYELSLEPVTKNTLTKLLQSDSNNRTRCLTGNTSGQGIKSGSYLEIHSGPMQAISDFRRSNVFASGFAPAFSQPVGNSTASPVIGTDSVSRPGPTSRLLDHSMLGNHALYDGFYFSTFATNGARSPEDSFEKFMDGSEPLLAQAFLPYLPSGQTAAKARSDLFDSGNPNNTAYRQAAQYQFVQGSFNVNSTHVQAWKARLASLRNSSVPTLPLAGGSIDTTATTGTPVLPMTMPNGKAVDSSLNPSSDAGRENQWSGFRQLTDKQLDDLAKNIVKEVRKRGPFLSMSEFVNRRVGSNSEETRKGALEAAIDTSDLNGAVFSSQVQIGSGDIGGPEYGFATPEVVTGNPAAGAPGWISQGDLMKVLEPAATVRSDTFVIRVCGEAKSGEQTARAYAEAVIQRVPDYVDPATDPSGDAYTGDNATNKTFGRRMQIVSFRWLSSHEI